MSDVAPTADDLALAREIVSLFDKWLDLPEDDNETPVTQVAALIAKHRQPPPEPPLTDAERKAWIEKTLNCTLVELFTCKHTPSIDELQAENERLLAALTTRIGAWQTIPEVLRTLATGKFDKVMVTEWAKDYSPILDAALTPKGPTP